MHNTSEPRLCCNNNIYIYIYIYNTTGSPHDIIHIPFCWFLTTKTTRMCLALVCLLKNSRPNSRSVAAPMPWKGVGADVGHVTYHRLEVVATSECSFPLAVVGRIPLMHLPPITSHRKPGKVCIGGPINLSTCDSYISINLTYY